MDKRVIFNKFALLALLGAIPGQALAWEWPSFSMLGMLKKAADYIPVFNNSFTGKVGLGTTVSAAAKTAAVVVPTYMATRVILPARHQSRVRTLAITTATAGFAYTIYNHERSLHDDVANIKCNMATKKQVADLATTVNGIGNTVTATANDVTAIRSNMATKTQLDEVHASLKASMDGAVADILKLRTQNDGTFKKITEINDGLSTLTKKVDTGFAQVDKRLDGLSTDQKTIAANLAALKTDGLAKHTTVMAAIKASNDNHATALAGLELRLTEKITQLFAGATTAPAASAAGTTCATTASAPLPTIVSTAINHDH